MIAALRGCLALLVASGPVRTVAGAEGGALKNLTIPNFHQTTDTIFRGGRPRADDIRALAHFGVKTIVNLQGRDSRPWLRRGVLIYQAGERRANIEAERILSQTLGMNWLNLPFNSLLPASEDDAAHIAQALEVIADPKNHPVFIHCEHGRDRTGIVIALYRVLKEGWTPARAYAEWVALGHAGWLTLKFTGNLDVHFRRVLADAGYPNEGGLLLKGMTEMAQPAKPAAAPKPAD